MTPVVRDEEAAGSDPGHPDSVKHQVRAPAGKPLRSPSSSAAPEVSESQQRRRARGPGNVPEYACNVERGRCLLLAQDSLDQILSP